MLTPVFCDKARNATEGRRQLLAPTTNALGRPVITAGDWSWADLMGDCLPMPQVDSQAGRFPATREVISVVISREVACGLNSSWARLHDW